MASISDIKAVSYDICGMVQTIRNDYRAKVIAIFLCTYFEHVTYSY